MRTDTQLNITVPNVPSSLAKVCDKLRSANVNIVAITCTEGEHQTIIHLVVDDLDTAKMALHGTGTVTTTDIIGFQMKNTPGMIASLGRACAAAGINIGNIYATTCGKEAMVYVTVDDIARAVELLKPWKAALGR